MKLGKVNASLPEGVKPEDITMEQALDLIKARGGGDEETSESGGGKKSGGKKSAGKKTRSAKPAAEKTPEQIAKGQAFAAKMAAARLAASDKRSGGAMTAAKKPGGKPLVPAFPPPKAAKPATVIRKK